MVKFTPEVHKADSCSPGKQQTKRTLASAVRSGRQDRINIGPGVRSVVGPFRPSPDSRALFVGSRFTIVLRYVRITAKAPGTSGCGVVVHSKQVMVLGITTMLRPVCYTIVEFH